MKEVIKELELLISHIESLPIGERDDNYPEIESLFIELFKDSNNYYAVVINNIEDGSYFGKQCNVTFYRAPFDSTIVDLEIAWDNTQISIYTTKHNGFWVPSYTTNKNVLESWKSFLKEQLYL